MLTNSKKLRQIFYRLRGRHVQFDLKPHKKLLTKINRYKHELETVDDSHLKEMSLNLIAKARDGVNLDGLLVEAFALVCEASKRVLGLHPFDVQIIGGLALHQGMMAEMQTGYCTSTHAIFPTTQMPISP